MGTFEICVAYHWDSLVPPPICVHKDRDKRLFESKKSTRDAYGGVGVRALAPDVDMGAEARSGLTATLDSADPFVGSISSSSDSTEPLSEPKPNVAAAAAAAAADAPPRSASRFYK